MTPPSRFSSESDPLPPLSETLEAPAKPVEARPPEVTYGQWEPYTPPQPRYRIWLEPFVALFGGTAEVEPITEWRRKRFVITTADDGCRIGSWTWEHRR